MSEPLLTESDLFPSSCERSKVEKPCPMADQGCTWTWVDPAARTRHMRRMHGHEPYHRPGYVARATPERKQRRTRNGKKDKLAMLTDKDNARRDAIAQAATIQEEEDEDMEIPREPAVLQTETGCSSSSATVSGPECFSVVPASGPPLVSISSSSFSKSLDSSVVDFFEDSVDSATNLPQGSRVFSRSDSTVSSITKFFDDSASSTPTLRSRQISFASSRSPSPPCAPMAVSPRVVQSSQQPPSSEPVFDRSKKHLFA